MNAHLTIREALDNLVGGSVVAIHAVALPPDAVFPCIVYGQIFGGDGQNLSGGDGSIYRMRFQIDIFHPVYEQLMAIRSTLLSGFHQFVSWPVLGTRIDLDIPYVVDELGIEFPSLYRHIIDIGVDVDRAEA